MVTSKLRRAAIALASSLLLLSCASVGPKQLPTDQFNYNAAIAESTSRESAA